MTAIAAMQPYILPYLPYFQLIGAVDQFVILDDIQYIRRGWMNRNRILLNGQIHTFTLPVGHGHRDDLILNKQFATTISTDFAKFSRMLHAGYGKAAHWPVLQNLLGDMQSNLSSSFLDLAEYSITRVYRTLEQKTPIIRSSSLGISDAHRGTGRILAICEALSAHKFINLPGGRELYTATEFKACNIELCFLDGTFIAYPQYGSQDFIPGLSIVDFLANCPPEKYPMVLSHQI